ncbi:P-loop containing nucleoside triphosphate hydrolase protein [Scheffersomyces xylosifermentans]|uniref:P-loop containing nucleoside triphosphate hydrolase protein n=1 Tax=Scheffersomyces xylosifermentans TaxID=1304137 RepID=UPI00315C4C46
MSNMVVDVVSANAASSSKKRKRKRNNNKNKSTAGDEAHLSAANEIKHGDAVDFNTTRTNKKLKFDGDDIAVRGGIEEPEEEGEVIPFEDETSLPNGVDQRIEDEPKSDDATVEDTSSVAKDHKKKDKKSKKNISLEHHKNGKLNNGDSKKSVNRSNSGSRKMTFYDNEGEGDDDDDIEDYAGNRFYNVSDATRAQLQKKAEELLEIRQQLPVYQHKEEIIDYVAQNQVTIIIGETGSGKSTQIPQFLMPLNKKQIAVTQPRRVAAASLAARVSEEYGCQLGQEVGYQVRFSNVTHPQKTQLKYLTDGMLLRELMMDSKLSKYSTIILDEAHERTVLTDLIMGFLKQLIITKSRTDLKIIVMSATLNADLFSKFFNNAPILFVEGKMYPVAPFYLEDSSEDIVDTMVRSIIQINLSEQEGDILCFLPGQEEIDNSVTALTQLAPQLPKEAPLLVPLPLYAALSPAQQSKIFEKLPNRRRKVILATNIAETSITVSGVKYVIDSGLRKVKVWKHQLGLSTLLTTPISQASAKQRAGRAGRESAGKVYRLYSEKVFQGQLPKQQESEIMRNDVILPVLTLKRLGVDDLLNWSWLEHPGQEAILSALNSLYSLGAINDGGKVTSLGYKMAVLPLPPQLSVVLLTALDYGVLAPVIDIVSCLSVDNLVLNVGAGNGELRDEVNYKRRQYCPLGIKHGDLIALKEYFSYYMELSDSGNIAELKSWCKDMHFSYKGFKNVLKVRTQLKQYMITTIKQDDTLKQEEKQQQLRNLETQLSTENEDDGYDSDINGNVKEALDVPAILKSFLKGYVTNTAVGMPDRSYRTFNTGQLISIHPSSNLFGKVNLDAIMYIEYVYTAKGYGRSCSSIELSWLQEVAPHMLGASKINVHD